jgi:hypothetical protein
VPDRSSDPAKQDQVPGDLPVSKGWRSSITQGVGGREQWRGSATNSSNFDTDYTYIIPDISTDSYRHQYVEDAKRGVEIARRNYRRLFRLYWTLRGLAIFAGISVAAVAATPAPRWLLGLLGALAAAAETVIAAGNLHERAVVSGLLADRVAGELRDYSLQFGSYAKGDPLEILHSRIEKIRNEASTARFRLDRAVGNQHVQPSPSTRPDSAETDRNS